MYQQIWDKPLSETPRREWKASIKALEAAAKQGHRNPVGRHNVGSIEAWFDTYGEAKRAVTPLAEMSRSNSRIGSSRPSSR